MCIRKVYSATCWVLACNERADYVRRMEYEYAGDAISYLIAFSVVAVMLGGSLLWERRYVMASGFLAYPVLAWFVPELAAWMAVLAICGLVILIGYRK